MHHQSQGSRMEGQQVESGAAGHRNHRMVWSRMALCSWSHPCGEVGTPGEAPASPPSWLPWVWRDATVQSQLDSASLFELETDGSCPQVALSLISRHTLEEKQK